MTASIGQTWRNSHLARDSPSSSPTGPATGARPKSMAFGSTPSSSAFVHSRNQSFSALNSSSLAPARNSRERSTTPGTTTFAPKFIKTEEAQKDTEHIRGIEGENDFSGKRYVWIKDSQTAFVKGWIVEELEGNQLLIQCDDGSVC